VGEHLLDQVFIMPRFQTAKKVLRIMPHSERF